MKNCWKFWKLGKSLVQAPFSWELRSPPNITHLHTCDSSPSSVPQAHICLHRTAGHEIHMFWLTLGLLELCRLLALPQQPALGEGQHPCWHYSPSFLFPSLLCPYSARLKQETIDRKVIYHFYNLYPSCWLLLVRAQIWTLGLVSTKVTDNWVSGSKLQLWEKTGDLLDFRSLPSKQSPERTDVQITGNPRDHWSKVLTASRWIWPTLESGPLSEEMLRVGVSNEILTKHLLNAKKVVNSGVQRNDPNLGGPLQYLSYSMGLSTNPSSKFTATHSSGVIAPIKPLCYVFRNLFCLWILSILLTCISVTASISWVASSEQELCWALCGHCLMRWEVFSMFILRSLEPKSSSKLLKVTW